MNAKKSILALFLVAMMLCVAMPIAIQSEDAGSSVTVSTSAPEVTSVSVDPAVLVIVPGLATEAIITAEVFCPNGVDWIKSVELTKMEPYHDCPHFRAAFPLPVPLKLVNVEDGIRAKYTLNLEFPFCVPARDYKLTVTVTDKDGNTVTGTATVTIAETLAIAVTDVNYGTVAPGKSSDATSTVTNLGNVPIKFDEPDGIVPSDMHSGSDLIEAKNTEVKWDWKTVITADTGPMDAKFTLSVPFGTPPGTYTGRITFTPTPAK